MNRFTLLTILITTLLLGCQKEYPIDESDSKVVHSGSHMNIEIAKSIFYQNHLSKSFDQSSFFAGYLDDDGDCFNFEPLWILANEMQTIENTEIVTVPLAMPNEYILDGRGAQLVFYGNSECTVPAELILYDSKDYDSTRPAPVNNCSFTGAIATYDFCSCTSKVFPIEQGAILAELDGEFDSFEQCSQSDSSSYRNDPPCYDFGSNFWENVGSFFSGIWSGIVNIFSSSGSSSSSGSGSSNGWSGFSGYSGFPFYLPSGNNTGTNYPSGGSTTNPQINTIFDGMFFNGEGQLVITLLEDLIAENELFICTEDLHTEMYHCLALEHEDFEPCHPPVHGSSNQQNNGQLSLDSYIRFLRSTPSVSNCLAAAISQHQTSNTDMVAGDGMLLCFIDENNNFDISDEDLLGLFKTYCQQDETCITNAFKCLGRLEDFQTQYGVSITLSVIENIIFNNTEDVCSADDTDFDNQVFKELADYYATITPEDSSVEEDAGFFDRTLECWSFNFISQSSGSGQIACVDQLYLSKNFGGVHSNTPFFCGHFTVPKVRYNGDIISAGKAADCSAWAANAAAAVVGFAFARENYQMTDEAMKLLFKTTFGVKMALTDCGYGAMTECQYANCLATPSNAQWNEGFFEWLDEQLFGCE